MSNLLFWLRTGWVWDTRRTLCEIRWSVWIWLTTSCHVCQVTTFLYKYYFTSQTAYFSALTLFSLHQDGMQYVQKYCCSSLCRLLTYWLLHIAFAINNQPIKTVVLDKQLLDAWASNTLICWGTL